MRLLNQAIRNKQGIGVIEVLISISIAGVIITTVGTTLSSINRVNTASEMKEKALGYARQSLETVNALQESEFACSCSVDSCTATTCTSSSDGQPCTLIQNYQSCWTEYPDGITDNDIPLHIASGQFQEGQETIADDPRFTRMIMINNIEGDFNRKRISVTVEWEERDVTKSIELNTILTGWKNL